MNILSAFPPILIPSSIIQRKGFFSLYHYFVVVGRSRKHQILMRNLMLGESFW
jgi:hypothetical protein